MKYNYDPINDNEYKRRMDLLEQHFRNVFKELNIPINNNIYTTINNNIKRLPSKGRKKNYDYWLDRKYIGNHNDIVGIKDYYENKID